MNQGATAHFDTFEFTDFAHSLDVSLSQRQGVGCAALIEQYLS
jgi:hypothetical protein